MSERDLDARLDAVERALTDGDTDLTDLREASGVAEDLQALEARLDTVESRLDELEAGLEAVRGYAGNVRAVNREVERRASAALAKAETVETAVDGASAGRDRPAERSRDRSPDRTDRVEPADRTDRDDPPNGAHAKRTDRSPTGSAATTPAPSTDRNGATSADRDPTGPTAPDRRGDSRNPGRGRPDDRESDRRGYDRRDRDHSDRDEDRPRRDGSPESSPGSDSDSGTEQFIERVRDAL